MFEGLELSTTLPDGTYYNREFMTVKDTIFVDMSDFSLKTFADLRHKKLNSLIYQGKSLLPYIQDNTTFGSIFDNCYIPSSAYDIICKNKCAKIEVISETKISLTEYIDIYHNLIRSEIKKIYDKHDKVVLQYSGGIDSLLLLSHIINLGYLHKTTLAKYENYFAPEHPDLIRNSNTKKKAIEDFKKQFENKYYNFVELNFTLADWINQANSGTYYTSIRGYSNYFLFSKFTNSAVIAGHFGDAVLLHEKKWLEELISKAPNKNDAIKQLQDSLQNKNLYMNNYLNFDFEKDIVPLKYYVWHAKPWGEFTINNNIYYTPICVDTRICRKIDIKTVKFTDILDATVVREMIHRNVGNLLDEYIIHQGNLDSDFQNTHYIQKSKINENVITIPKNLKHDRIGLSNLLKELQNDFISNFSILACHNLKYISKLVN